MPIDRCMDKENVNTVKYYSALKNKEMLPFETTWMSQEDSMLSVIGQLQKDKYCMITDMTSLKKLNPE